MNTVHIIGIGLVQVEPDAIASRLRRIETGDFDRCECGTWYSKRRNGCNRRATKILVRRGDVPVGRLACTYHANEAVKDEPDRCVAYSPDMASRALIGEMA